REACDVGRYRPTPLMRWLHALGVVAAYVVIAAVLLWLDVGDFGTAPPWTVIVAPFFYAVLSLVLVPRATLQRRLRWVGGACLTHVILGLAAVIAFWTLVEVTLLSALASAFARLGPVPFLTLLATALALVPFRGRVLSRRPAPAARGRVHAAARPRRREPARAALDHRPSARRARAAAGGRRAGGLGARGLAVSVARVRGHGRGVPATVSRPEADAAARRCA